MKHLRRAVLIVALSLLAGPAWSGIDQELRSLIESDREAEARGLIERVLEISGQIDEMEASMDDRATALHWLGRLEVAEGDWSAARAAYGRLDGEFGETAAAADAATEIALLDALLGALDAPLVQAVVDPPPSPLAETTPAPPEPSARVARPKATPSAAPAATTTKAQTDASGVLVGAFGTPFEAAEEAGLQVQSFLTSMDIPSDFEATAGQALRGRDAVVAYLLTRVGELGRANLILVRSRWGFREFVEVESYGPGGALLWREKVTGGRALRDETVKQNLLDRLWPKLERHLGAS